MWPRWPPEPAFEGAMSLVGHGATVATAEDGSEHEPGCPDSLRESVDAAISGQSAGIHRWSWVRPCCRLFGERHGCREGLSARLRPAGAPRDALPETDRATAPLWRSRSEVRSLTMEEIAEIRRMIRTWRTDDTSGSDGTPDPDCDRLCGFYRRSNVPGTWMFWPPILTQTVYVPCPFRLATSRL